MNTNSPHENLNSFEFPPLDLLKTYDNEVTPVINPEEQDAVKERIANTLHRFGIDSTIKVTTGYVVSLYEIEPKEGVKIAQIKDLEDEILFGIAVKGVRIIAPMPGKGTVGIEVPNTMGTSCGTTWQQRPGRNQELPCCGSNFAIVITKTDAEYGKTIYCIIVPQLYMAGGYHRLRGAYFARRHQP